jgi:3-dehydroquinate synthase
MKRIRVNLDKRSYDIIIGKGAIKRLCGFLKAMHLGRDIFVITNANIYRRYGSFLMRGLGRGFPAKLYYTIDSEKAKSIANAVKIIEFLAGYAKQKKVLVCAFGGGVIGDLVGFIASVYKRGVPCLQIPTTLLAQIDSSIGGKTAIDLPIAKNLIGTFYQPRLVLCDLDFLMGLDKRQLAAGLAEAVKYAIIQDEWLFEFLEEEYQSIILNKDIQALEHLVYSCARIKAKILEADEREEKGLRTILNFGHTIGHAIEAAGKFERYGHGEAVALGMLCEKRISEDMGLLDAKTSLRITHLIAKIGLPQEIIGIKESEILKAYMLDKKFNGKLNRFVLIKGIGKPLVRENIPEKIIRRAIAELSVG